MEVSEELIESCIKKQHRGQKALYELSYGYLMKVSFRYAKTEDEAVEYLNIGFCKILQGLSKKPENVPYKFWARKILINSIIDEFRKTKKYKENIVLKEDNTFEMQSLERVVNDALSSLNVDDIYKLIKQLPPVTQKVFNLYVIDGYSHKEIAELLGMSDGTSKWHLSTAKKELKGKIYSTKSKLVL